MSNDHRLVRRPRKRLFVKYLTFLNFSPGGGALNNPDRRCSIQYSDFQILPSDSDFLGPGFVRIPFRHILGKSATLDFPP